VADAPLGAAGGPLQCQELACWALALEVREPFTVELVGELVQWHHRIPLVVVFGGVAAGRGRLDEEEEQEVGSFLRLRLSCLKLRYAVPMN
jgi:hypothetical protein